MIFSKPEINLSNVIFASLIPSDVEGNDNLNAIFGSSSSFNKFEKVYLTFYI